MLYHVSFFPVEQFYPRVPQIRCRFENAHIPRISFSCKSVLEALRAIPDAAVTIHRMLEIGIEPTIYVYSVSENIYIPVEDPRQSAEGIRLLPCEETAYYVPDAELHGECWLLDTPDMDDIFCKVLKITKMDCIDTWIADIKLEEVRSPEGNLERIFSYYKCEMPDSRDLAEVMYPGNENVFLANVLGIMKKNRNAKK